MKIIIGVVFSIIGAGITSWFMPSIVISETTLNTFYTVSGIMFSIGMGLSISSNTFGVKNNEIRKRIRKSMKRIRTHFIEYFSVSTSIYVLTLYKKTLDFSFFTYKIDCVTLIFLILSILYFVINLLAIQRLNEDIEDAINNN